MRVVRAPVCIGQTGLTKPSRQRLKGNAYAEQNGGNGFNDSPAGHGFIGYGAGRDIYCFSHSDCINSFSYIMHS